MNKIIIINIFEIQFFLKEFFLFHVAFEEGEVLEEEPEFEWAELGGCKFETGGTIAGTVPAGWMWFWGWIIEFWGMKFWCVFWVGVNCGTWTYCVEVTGCW